MPERAALVPVRPRTPGGPTRTALLVFGALALAALTVDGAPAGAGGGLRTLGRILGGMLTPDLSPRYLAVVLGDAAITASYALAAMSLAGTAGVAAAVVASGVLYDRRWIRTLSRIVLALVRSVHELVWALLFVYAAGLSPSAGVLAIAVPYTGVIGRVLGDRLRDADPAPVAALAAAGASRTARLLYGIAPQGSADATGYLAYRLECALRSAARRSFVGLGRLGARVELAPRDLDYGRAWTPIYATILLVILADRLGVRHRRRFAR